MLFGKESRMKYPEIKNTTYQAISATSNGLEIRYSEKVTTFLSQLISVIYMPFLAPTYLFTLLFSFYPKLTPDFSPSQKIIVSLGILVTTTLLPMILVFILYKLKKINSLLLEKKEDRLIPQLFSCLLYLAITLGLMHYLGLHHVLTLVMLANTISLILISFITPYWKISTHSCGAFGTLSILICVYLKFPVTSFVAPLSLVFIASFLVGIARIYLRVHTPLQVIMGGLLGTAIGSFLFCI